MPMASTPITPQDLVYLQIILDRIAVCASYQPRFGQAQAGITLADFRTLYGSDHFYTWFGLDTPRVYAAHRAAGGITSIYRQIGIGSELLLRQIIRDQLGLTATQAQWSYTIATNTGTSRTLKLDARIILADIQDGFRRQIVAAWLQHVSQTLGLEPIIATAMQGVVIEIRQGYKSKDAKRQHADVANAATAYTQGYIPVLLLLSNQFDTGVIERYTRARWHILRGNFDQDTSISTYTFFREIIGYDLAAFFHRVSPQLQQTMAHVLYSLLEVPDEREATL